MSGQCGLHRGTDGAERNGMYPNCQSDNGTNPNLNLLPDIASSENTASPLFLAGGTEALRQKFDDPIENDILGSLRKPAPKADQSVFIREKWEYARRINDIERLWAIAGDDWMR